MSFHKFIAEIHKWVGLLLVQLLFWTAGGFVMSYFEIEKVRGEHKVVEQPSYIIAPNAYDPEVMKQILASKPGRISNVSATHLYGKAVYKVDYKDKSSALFDPHTGTNISPLNQQSIKEIATKLYSGDSEILALELLHETGIEYRSSLPVWKVDFADSDETSFYFHPDTGRLMARRTKLWRIYDFMWMLHIMDYDERDDFNHPLLYIFSALSVLFIISGIFLIYYRFSRRDFRWLGLGK